MINKRQVSNGKGRNLQLKRTLRLAKRGTSSDWAARNKSNSLLKNYLFSAQNPVELHT